MHSFLITGGTEEERFNKALSYFPKKPPHPDLIIVKGENSIGIKDIKELIHKITLKPFEEEGKITIIKGAEKLTTQAQNCLLKTLEEPPSNTKIILLTGKPFLISSTIRSRCQVLNLKLKEEFILDEKLFLENLKFLKEIFLSREGERLRFSAKIPQEKEEACRFFTLLIATCQWLLLFNYGIKRGSFSADVLNQAKEIGATAKNLVQIIRLTIFTKQLIEKNVNLKLAIDCFLLDLPKVSS